MFLGYIKLMSFIERIKHFDAFLFNRYRLVLKPQELHIAINSDCNLNCSLCPREAIPALPKNMPFDSFKKIFNIYDPEFVSLNFYNEPLLHPDISKFVNFLSKRGIFSSIETNGLLLTESVSNALFKQGLGQLIVSIDAFSPEKYKIMRGGNLHTVIENSIKAFEISKNYNTSMSVQFVLSNLNNDELEDFKSFWRQHRIDVKIKPVNSRAGLLHKKYIRKNPCFRTISSIAVHTDGDLSPCCLDYSKKFIIGNIFSDSKTNIISNKRLTELRKKHFIGDFPDLCKNCDKDDFPKPLSSLLLLIPPYSLRWLARRFRNRISI